MKKLIKIPIWEKKLLIVTYPTNVLKAAKDSKMARELISQVREGPPEKSWQGCLYFDDKRGQSILWFPNNKPRTDTIIHETNHLVKFLMEFIGAEKEFEAHAYTQEWLYNTIKKILRG